MQDNKGPGSAGGLPADFPPSEGVYKCASVYKPIKSRVSCVTSVYISVYKGDDMEERSSKSEMQREIFAGGKSGDPRRYE